MFLLAVLSRFSSLLNLLATCQIEPIGATFFHPNFPTTHQIVTCSGTRKFPLQRRKRRQKDGEDDESSDDQSDSDGERETLAGEAEEDGKDSLQVFSLG